MSKVLVREEIAEAGIRLLRERGFEVDVDGDSDLADSIGRYDAIIVRSATKVTADLIARADNLKVIGRAGVGIDNVDVDAATRRGIVVANAPESTVISAAEHTIGLLVALTRNIPQAHAALKQGRWERKTYGGVELADKTLGVLGFGRIGQQVARRAAGLGMRVIAYDPFVSPERFRELGVERVERDQDVYAAADFLTLHLPLTDETRKSINADAFGKMRDGVRIVNAARGALVDEDDLLAALRSGKVGGAALDVFSTEPYSGPLLEEDNVVVTPHLAASTEEAQDRAGLIIAEQVAAALDGGLVSNAVNIPVIGAEDLEVLGAYIPLAAKLGRLAMELAQGRVEELRLTYFGALAQYDTRLLTVAALNGAFQGRSDQPVNYVNAPMIAAERGVDVREERSRSARDYTNLVRVEAVSGGQPLRVAGTTMGNDNRLWLVSALGFELDMELAPLLVVFRYDDVPGVIGKVGTLFGAASVNIANMTVSRTRQGGQALMALSIDSPAPAELVHQIHSEFDDARFISLE
ncbi:MAG: phosphoglycerate dehydrogenase [Actinobacteria bacterium]|nr:MAG: phosphoglycerate dehydrogenase [Actinomycetota bacterium]TML91140.1 MAG: phosphoglycerate dehydrogenase [Actinomycetota bacterium]